MVIAPSNVFGYLLKISLKPIIASWITKLTWVLTNSTNVSTHLCAACSNLIAHCPINFTLLLTNLTSTSEEYSLNSFKTMSILFILTNLYIISNFSNLLYKGSVNEEKNIFISFSKIIGLFWIKILIFFNATYWISGSLDNKVTKLGVIFLQTDLMVSGFSTKSNNFIKILITERTTPAFECDTQGIILSIISLISSCLVGLYLDIPSNK